MKNLNEGAWLAPAALNLKPGQPFDGYYDRLPTGFTPGCPSGIPEPYIHPILIRSGAFKPAKISGENVSSLICILYHKIKE